MLKLKKLLAFSVFTISGVTPNLANAQIVQFFNTDYSTVMSGYYKWKSDYVYDGLSNWREEYPYADFYINFNSLGGKYTMNFSGPGCGNEKTCSAFNGSTREDLFYTVSANVNRIGTYYGDFKYIQLWNVQLSRYYDPFEGYSLDNPTIYSTSSHVVAFVSGVPEPETYGMMLLGLGLLGFVARRKQA
jgi:hypothetical protein